MEQEKQDTIVSTKGERTGRREVYEDAVLDLLGHGEALQKLDDVFYGYFASQMIMRSLPDDTPFTIGVRPTLAGVEVGINLRKFEDKYNHDERKAIIKHEVLHVIMNHPIRYGDMEKKILAVVSDLAINQLIDGLPKDAITLDFMKKTFPKSKWPEKESMENYYAILKQELEDRPPSGGKNGDGGGDGSFQLPNELDDHSGWGGEGMSESEREAANAACEALIPEMASKAEQKAISSTSSGKLSADLQRAIDILRRKKTVNWKKLLRMQMSFEQRVQRMFTNKKTNRRWPHRPDVPGVRKIGGINAVDLFDVSGSMTDRSIAVVSSELINLCKQFSTELTQIQVDTEVKVVEKFTARNKTIKRSGQGGTILYPGVEYVRKNNIKHDVLIVVTDGELYEDMWPEPPTCKTIFLVVGGPNAHLSLDTSNFKVPPVVIIVPEDEL